MQDILIHLRFILCPIRGPHLGLEACNVYYLLYRMYLAIYLEDMHTFI